MEVNTITTIFLITFNLKLGHKKKQDDIDWSKDSIFEVMHNYLDV
jgi:hypothetical protein